MLDYQVAYTFTDGVVFPNTTAINETVPGAKDGTEFVKIMIDDIWGARQALMDEVGLVPDGVTEKIVTSQQLAALKLLIAQENVGKNVQEVFVEYDTASSLGVLPIVPQDDTIPQYAEMTNIAALDAAITPNNAANIIEIEVIMQLSTNTGGTLLVGMFADGAGGAIVINEVSSSSGFMSEVIVRKRIVAGSVAARTYNVNVGLRASGTMFVNSTAGSRLYGGVLISSIKLTEVTP